MTSVVKVPVVKIPKANVAFANAVNFIFICSNLNILDCLKQNQESVNKHDKEALYRYYTGKTMELKNINALKHGKNNLRFKYRGTSKPL
jgi:hypothetical protein